MNKMRITALQIIIKHCIGEIIVNSIRQRIRIRFKCWNGKMSFGLLNWLHRKPKRERKKENQREVLDKLF